MIYNQIFVLRAILLRREERHCRGQWTRIGYSKALGSAVASRSWNTRTCFSEVSGCEDLIFWQRRTRNAGLPCWPSWPCWPRWRWGHSAKVVCPTSREGVSSGRMVPRWEKHGRAAPQPPPPPYTGGLSEVSFQTFQAALFLDLMFKSKTMLFLKEQNTAMPLCIKIAIQRTNITSGTAGVNWPRSSPWREQLC